MFMRFVITQIDEASRQPQGVFAAAYALVDSGELSAEERKQLSDVMIWFNKHLPSPRGSFDKKRAIFWFKSSADECLKQMWEMVHLLRSHGYLVEVQKCRALGNIAWEDRFQVAAYPSVLDSKVTFS